jgi:hypothetical protein
MIPFPLVVIIDLGLLFVLPWIMLKSFWRAIIFFGGFLVSQHSWPAAPWAELFIFELGGIFIMLSIIPGKVTLFRKVWVKIKPVQKRKTSLKRFKDRKRKI